MGFGKAPGDMANRYPQGYGRPLQQPQSPQRTQHSPQNVPGRHDSMNAHHQAGPAQASYSHRPTHSSTLSGNLSAQSDPSATFDSIEHSYAPMSPYDNPSYTRGPPQYDPRNYQHVTSPQNIAPSSLGYAGQASNDWTINQTSSYNSPYSPSNSHGYGIQSPVPPPRPPKIPEHGDTSLGTYSSYSQPSPQMATSYLPNSSRLPYPDYNASATTIPNATQGYTFAGNSTADELYLPPVQSSSYTPDQGRYFQSRNSAAPYLAQSASAPSLPPPPPPPAHGSLRTNPSVRHPQSRPLPGPPVPDVGPDFYRPPARLQTDSFDYSAERQDELSNEVESAIMKAGSPMARSTEFSTHSGGQVGFGSPDKRRYSQPNPHSPISTRSTTDSDAEALAGLEAMRIADEEDAADEARRLQTGSQPHLPRQPGRGSIDSGYNRQIDADMYGSHGRSPDLRSPNRKSLPPSPNESYQGRPRHEREMSYDSYDEVLQTLPEDAARVDFGGTGGLVDASKSPRRDEIDDEDAYSFTEEGQETSGPPDLFFMPDTSSFYRPLPAPPSWSNESWSDVATPSPSSVSVALPPTPSASVRLPQSHSEVSVPRFQSLRELSTGPPVGHPTRSKTDAEERIRKPGLGLHTSFEYRNSAMITLPATPAANTMTIDLPSLPSKRFNVAKLGPADFDKCEEPWALSAIYHWIRYIANPEQVTELKEAMIREALTALFTNKVPTLNIIDIEALAQRVILEMFDAGVLRRTEEWVRLVPGTMNGVLVQITQRGCYSSTLHDHAVPGRCYSSRCQRSLRKVDLQATFSRPGEDWATYYKLTKEGLEEKDKKEIERQNILHEIVQTEDQYMGQIDVLQHVYRDTLATSQPAIIDQKRLNLFLRDVFGKIDSVRKANEEHLLAHLRYRQDEQGPWIVGFSDIFRQWIRKARQPYIEYAVAFPAATLLVRQEMERNLDFRAFLDSARANKASNRLGLDTYLKAPITRLQRYSLLLATVHKNMIEDSDEKTNLQTAIDEIKDVTKECDARVAEVQRKVDLADLGQKLILRPGMSQEVALNLDFLGRRLLHRGDLLRTGSSRFNWVECHTLLFDHYLILAKTIQRGAGAKAGKYDVSRFPIPMDLLVLESFDEDPVRQGHYIRALTTTVTTGNRGTPDLLRGRADTVTSPTKPLPAGPGFTVSVAPTTTITEAAKDTDKILYPFKIKHLGREAYTLFAQSAGQRSEWEIRLTEAKRKHAKLLHRQNSEPFGLRIMADTAFFYDSSVQVTGSRAAVIEGTPMDRAIEEIETRFKGTGRPGPVCRARINCATSFNPSHHGKQMVVVGTDFGVFVSGADDPRGWTRVIAMTKITQIAVLEEFGVLLLISNGSLIAYPLDIIIDPAPADGTPDTAVRRPPQKLSGAKDVGFFAVGRMKDRTLVFYKKRDGLTSTFKVLEPVFQKSSEARRNIFKRANTDYFRDFDEFYIPAECGGMNLFTNSLSVSTSRGFEVLTLDKKQPFSVPDLRAPEVSNMAQHIEGQNTLGMLRLSDQELILCYEKCALYVNKHGDISRSVIMNFVGKAKSAALHGEYLLLFDTDFVEIRNAQNGRLKQIVSGRDIRCIDDGGGGTFSGGLVSTPGGVTETRTVKVAMAHPANERSQIVVELVLNPDLKD